jgi:uncharacterized protein YndB with AHSA1/START domain
MAAEQSALVQLAGGVLTRSASYCVSIDAPPDVLWAALTDPRELERWFPLTAQVTPGVGGLYSLRWRDRHAGDDWPVLAWDPGRHLAVGMPKPASGSPPAHVVNDFVLEDHESHTVLRLVVSGFDPDAKWDTFFNGVRRGWRYELGSLKHYLEHHRGRARVVAWAHARVMDSFDDAWAAIFGPGGWTPNQSFDALRPGDRYALTAPDGLSASGTLAVMDRPTDFSGTIDELNDALFRVQLEPSHADTMATVWVAGYGVDVDRMVALETSWQAALERVLGTR